jgi:hypothetical protein
MKMLSIGLAKILTRVTHYWHYCYQLSNVLKEKHQNDKINAIKYQLL